MTPQYILLPIFLHVALVIFVGVMMGRARFRAVSKGERKRHEVSLNNKNWPDDVLKIGNNFDNQFQLPVLWYALTAFILATQLVDQVAIALSWAFLLSRIVHSYIHVTSNKLPDRFYAYLFGMAVFVAMWIWFALRLFVIG